MILHMRCGNILLFLFIIKNYVGLSVENGTDSVNDRLEDIKNDEANLKQAIFLVKLLRKEYENVLRENEALRASLSRLSKGQLCPILEEPAYDINEGSINNVNDGRIATPYPMTIHPRGRPSKKSSVTGPRGSYVTHHPSVMYQKMLRNHYAYPKRFYRRQIPSDYDYGFGPYRRLDHVDTENQQTQNETILLTLLTEPHNTTVGASTTTTVSTTTTLPRRTTKKMQTSTPKPADKIKKQTHRRKPSNASQKNKEIKIISMKKPASSTVDPVLQQVQLELKHELNEHETRRSQKTYENKQPFIRKGDIQKISTSSVRIPTTIRIHLDRSTRYNIPFPVNHAFCYTNPNNPLCRTVI